MALVPYVSPLTVKSSTNSLTYYSNKDGSYVGQVVYRNGEWLYSSWLQGHMEYAQSKYNGFVKILHVYKSAYGLS